MVPSEVRRAFGVDTAKLQRLSGGLGSAYRSGAVVFKEVDDADDAEFIAEVMNAVEVDEALVRVSRPVQGTSGAWVVDGWSAWTLIEGAHAAGAQQWAVAPRAIAALHHGLAAVTTATELPSERGHRWAVADRVAWDEQDADLDPRVAELVTQMRAIQIDVDEPLQLIHGDLAGNLLFHESAPPGIIDFSPFLRPTAHALAIYLVDAVGWHQANRSVLESLASDPAVRACLPRAAIFRLVALDGFRSDDDIDIGPLLADHERICNTIAIFVSR